MLVKRNSKSVDWFTRYGLLKVPFDSFTLFIQGCPGPTFMDQKTFFFVHAPYFDALYRFLRSKLKFKIFDIFQKF